MEINQRREAASSGDAWRLTRGKKQLVLEIAVLLRHLKLQ
jgi:hypothetical protein